MTAIIIEDEIPAARRLEKLLSEKDFTVFAIVHSVKSAVSWLKDNAHPDLIFMDIKLRDGLCFPIFDKVKIQSKVVFTTAFDEFALKAFEYNSLDYLLKPIDVAKLDKLIAKLETFKAVFYDSSYWKILETSMSDPYKASFLVNSGMSVKKISTADIPYFLSQNNTTFLCFENRKFPIQRSLEKLESELHPAHFFRISRKYVVNRKFIIEFQNDFNLRLQNSNEKFPVSRQRRSAFMAWYKE
ncbi:LytR/AlgR family response regulator transcription factor [Flavobacterium sp. 3HN19-14]|uniref:LytR/AlgR family response regulator transcription factor n=1 Tax=Flavobacterium sp. 3HN19-14 TaxID=3448133 RepID=UPI003EE133B6